jgi:hypothetical protein
VECRVRRFACASVLLIRRILFLNNFFRPQITQISRRLLVCKLFQNVRVIRGIRGSVPLRLRSAMALCYSVAISGSLRYP